MSPSKIKENWVLRSQNSIHTNIFYTEKELKQIKKEFLKYCRENNISTSRWEIMFNKFKGHNVKFIKQRIKRLLAETKPNVTKYKMFLIYGNIDGRKYWEEYVERQRYTNSKEYKGMTDLEFKEYNLSRAVTKENLIKKHGNIEGLKKWNEYINKQKYTKSLQRYIDEFGLEEGFKKFKEINKKKINAAIKSKNGYSQVSNILFKQLESKLNSKCYYGKNEFVLEKDDSFYLLDFYCPEFNFIIEFDGDIFHGNPKYFTEDDTPNPYNKKLSCKEIWKKDFQKTNYILSKGFRLLRLWESTFVNNDNVIVDDIVSHIKETDIAFYQI